MKINNKKDKNSRVLVIVMITLLVTTIGLFAYWKKDMITDWFGEETVKVQQLDDKEQTKDIDDTPIKDEELKPDTNSTKLDDNATTSTSLAISIKSFSQTATEIKVSTAATGGTVGTCIFTFSGDESRPVSRTVETSDGNCSTSIPAVEFDRVGTWKLTVTFYQKSTEKAEDSRDVTIS